MMVKKSFVVFCFLLPFSFFAQEDAWVYFTDKPLANLYLADPSTMLTQRALERRQAQNIAVDIYDVPVHTDYIEALADNGLLVMASSKWLNAAHVRGTVEAIQAMAIFPFVSEIRFADRSLNAAGKWRAPAVVQQRTNLASFPYGNSGNQIEMLNGHLLHEQDFTGQGKIIAVLDSGFPGVDVLPAFERIRSSNQILDGYNFVQDNENYYSLNGHGTMVLSTMAGYIDSQLVGTAPDAMYLLYITEDVASENPVEESYWVAAAEEADRLGADIINTSLGYFLYDNPAYNYTYEDLNGETSFISRGVNMAFSRGMVVVVSAGNSGGSGNPFVGMPADAPGALTVGAVDAAGNYVGFSSRGPTADGRVKPDVMAKGAGATVTSTNGNIIAANGTSFSGPIIAGMVATFWSAVPSLTNAEVVNFIRESAHLFSLPSDTMGYGIPDFQIALGAALQLPTFTAQPIMLSPNPCSNTLVVKLPEEFVASQLKLYTPLGQLVMDATIEQASTIDVSGLGAGMYFYLLAHQNQLFSGRLIKQ